MSTIKIKIITELLDKFSQSILTNQQLNSDALQNVLNDIGLLAIASGENGRPGFQNTCLLLQKTISDLVDSSQELNAKQIESVRHWRIIASNYLKDSKHSTIDVLTDFFKRSELKYQSKEDELEKLNDLLVKESQQFYILFSDIHELLVNNIPVDPLYIIEKIETLLLSINENDFPGFLDACLLLQENLSDIESQNNSLNQKQNELILKWLSQAELYLLDSSNTEAATTIINILMNEEWPSSLSEADATIFLEMLGLSTDSNSKDNSSSIPTSLLELFDKLQKADSLLDENNRETVQNIANLTEELGLLAAEIDLLAFQDICFIIMENLSDMVNDELLSLQKYISHIKKWVILVKSYLSNTDNVNTVHDLLNYLTDAQWPQPQKQADLDILKDMFGLKDQAVDKLDLTMVAAKDQMDLTIVTTNEQVQDALNEILDEVIDTKDILAAPHTISKDLVEMLREEVVIIQDEVKNHIKLIDDEKTDTQVIADSLTQYAIHIERFGNACQAAELDGLHQVSSVFSNNLNQFSKSETKLSAHQITILSSLPDKIFHYLEEPGNYSCSEELATLLKDDALPKNLMHGVAPALINLLKAVYVSDKDVNKEVRQTVATAEDISIELPADINQELLDGLLQELPGQTEGFSSAIQSLIDGSGNFDDVQKAQRIAHTVKGAANTVGVRGIATLTHHLEEILSALNKLNHLPSSELASVFMDAADCLEEMSEALLERRSSPSHSQQVLQSVLDWAIRIESEGIDCLTSGEETSPSSVTKTKKSDESDTQVEESSTATTLRVPADLIDEVLRLLGETMIVTSQLQERVRLSTLQSHKLIEHQNMVKNLSSDLEVQVDINSSVANHKLAVNQNEVFDSLELEEYNELHTVTHQIVEASVDSYEFNQEIATDLRDLDELLIEKLRLHNEIQDLVMRTRMVPIKTIMPRLQRIVRQTCRTTNKLASLEITGSDTLIDSNIINRLIDPLMHMLRNAVDHGIESREQRIKIKKQTEGKLNLSFYREGTQIVVRCQDDGAGLDSKYILETAIKRNIVTKKDKLTKNEINRLILHPSFSTREKATQTSGRGVGMDIVHTELLAMKGSVHIESKKGKGCLIELRMPVTLMSSHALLLHYLNQTIAISNRGIEKILHSNDSQITTIDDETFCEVDGEKFPMLTLESLLHLPEDKREDGNITRPALLIREEEINHVVYIHEIFDTRDLFIKSMGKYLNNIKGILGATILGDGSVVPVVDLPELIRAPATSSYDTSELTQSNIPSALPIALVIDDSLSARRALAQVIQDAGFDVRTAIDGLEAIGLIEKNKPDIILVDMEMPRMNGMELTSHLRGFDRTKDIPVIMVTSRSTDKHRKQAEAAGVDVYVTKPFTDDDLLDHVHNLLN